MLFRAKRGNALTFSLPQCLQKIFLGAFSRPGFSTICVRGSHFTSKLQGRFDFACTLTSKSSRICLGSSLSLWVTGGTRFRCHGVRSRPPKSTSRFNDPFLPFWANLRCRKLRRARPPFFARIIEHAQRCATGARRTWNCFVLYFCSKQASPSIHSNEGAIASLTSTLDFTSIDEMDPSLGALTLSRAVCAQPGLRPYPATCPAAENHKIFYEREVPFELRSADGLDAPQASALPERQRLGAAQAQAPEGCPCAGLGSLTPSIA